MFKDLDRSLIDACMHHVFLGRRKFEHLYNNGLVINDIYHHDRPRSTLQRSQLWFPSPFLPASTDQKVYMKMMNKEIKEWDQY